LKSIRIEKAVGLHVGGQMRKVAWVLVAVLLSGLAVSSPAEAPKCENQKKEMDQAQLAMTNAWDAWRRAMAEVDAARQAERDALKALQDAAGVAALAAQQLADAVAATNACHQRNGYGSQCATQERAEASARDSVNRSTAARSTANSKFSQASSRVSTAERQEASLYTTADRLERSYLQYVDAYNACLRSKPKFS
jgi:hypothetical protein